MNSATFDSFSYFTKLKAAGMPEEQAKIMADAMRGQSEAQAMALTTTLKDYDAARQKELTTKGDTQEIRLEIEKVRAEMKTMEIHLLKWQIGGWLILTAIMAKGFGWLGF